MTLKEIYQALLDGKKLCCPDIGFMYVHLKDGGLKHEDGSFACISFTLGTWSIYEDPEDLDEQIQSKKKQIVRHFDESCNASVCLAIAELIDLKIKQAKL